GRRRTGSSDEPRNRDFRGNKLWKRLASLPQHSSEPRSILVGCRANPRLPQVNLTKRGKHVDEKSPLPGFRDRRRHGGGVRGRMRRVYLVGIQGNHFSPAKQRSVFGSSRSRPKCRGLRVGFVDTALAARSGKI